MERREPNRACRGFTLVELLVVIGIIGLLISLLLPTLQGARRAAQQTACAAKLHNIMLAAELHRQGHHDYYPLAGVVPSRQPEKLEDPYAIKYDYLSYSQTFAGFKSGGAFLPRKLASLADGLSVYMGFKSHMLVTDNDSAVRNMFDAQGYMRNFLCPAQASTMGEIAPANAPQNSCVLFSLDDNTGYFEPGSYVYNEYILGFFDPYKRLRGRASFVHQPSRTMFAADGLHGRPGAEVTGAGTVLSTFMLWNVRADVPVSVGDALTNNSASPTKTKAFDPACFDKRRHNGRMNIACCDGHVENRAVTVADLNNVYLVAP